MKNFFRNSNVYLICAFIIMGILFYSSSQTYEQQSQIGFLQKYFSNEPFKEQLSRISFVYASDEVSIQANGYFKFVEFFIRKGAHILTYFLLGGSWFLGLRPRINQSVLTAVVAWLTATGYAALDEIHQMITGGRTPLFQDIALDSAGALLAVLFCLLFAGLKGRKSRVQL
ncbi:VanZ family protein [Enterococcus sp. BWB1-3]|uniref:VanZ family protein n=1 Tax=Enterococcus sp. BWB1-3 TaxID=2787713 RepID=UPI00192080F7|nr:VanZ family protein [Enterococcus sp. BWB1-3]